MVEETIKMVMIATATWDSLFFLLTCPLLLFKYSTISGISVGIDDLTIPDIKNSKVEQAENEIKQITEQYQSSLITENERYNNIIRNS